MIWILLATQANSIAISPLPQFTYPVSEVKNERNCNASYLFSSISALESAYAQKFNLTQAINFSEQWVLSNANVGCTGGTPDTVLDYLSHFGTYREPIYPYYGVKIDLPPRQATVYNITHYKKLSVSSSDDFLAYLSNSSIIVGFYIDNPSKFPFYPGGLYTCGAPSTQVHYMLAANTVGSEPNTIYLKNNWGTGWGERGLLHLDLGTNSTGPCDIFQEFYIVEI